MSDGPNYRIVDTGIAPWEIVAVCAECGKETWAGCTYRWLPGPNWRCGACVALAATDDAVAARAMLRRAAMHVAPAQPPAAEGSFTARARQMGLLD